MAIGIFVWCELTPLFLQKNVPYRPRSGGYTYTRLREADSAKNIDALVVGSSHAYREIDPRIFEKEGVKIFNLGSSAQTPIQTLYLLEKYLDIIKPKVVLYETYFKTFQLDGIESAADLYSNTTPIDRGLLRMALKINAVQSYNTLLYAWIKQMLPNSHIESEKLHLGNDTYVKGGYVEREIKYYKKNTKHVIGVKYEFDDNQVDAFNKIVLLLKQKNIKLILFEAPVPVSTYQTISDQKTFENFVGSKGEFFYNYNHNHLFTDSDFYDDNHLNQIGVDKFDAIFIDSLKSNKSIANLLFD